LEAIDSSGRRRITSLSSAPRLDLRSKRRDLCTKGFVVSESWVKLDAPSAAEYATQTANSDHHDVYIQDWHGVRAMSFNLGPVQSAMKVARPEELAGEYTRRIMAFLLFHPAARRIVMIGLGGGSLAKFVYREMPEASITVVEVNPKVVAAARSHFQLPQDDARLHIVIDEGSHYVATHEDNADVLIVDGFDLNGQPPSLCTQSFYDDCRAALRPGGVLVVNILGIDDSMDLYLERMDLSFGGTLLTLPSDEDGNFLVFAFQDAQPRAANEELIERAAHLQGRYGLAFPVFVRALTHASGPQHSIGSHQYK
jgi:spermidine synthase